MKNIYAGITELKIGKITEAQFSLFDGLIRLWSDKPHYKITVKELIEISHVARSTFYVYYQNIEELIEEVENYHIIKLMNLNNELMNSDIKAEDYSKYYKNTISYVQNNKIIFYAFLISNINNEFIRKWKEAIKYQLWERDTKIRDKQNCHLVLEMVSSQVISAYTFYLTNPSEVDIESLDKIVTQTLKSIEFYK